MTMCATTQVRIRLFLTTLLAVTLLYADPVLSHLNSDYSQYTRLLNTYVAIDGVPLFKSFADTRARAVAVILSNLCVAKRFRSVWVLAHPLWCRG